MTVKKRSRQPDEKETKGEVVRMRVTVEQKQAFITAAAREGLELSQWLRQLAMRAAGILPMPDKRR